MNNLNKANIQYRSSRPLRNIVIIMSAGIIILSWISSNRYEYNSEVVTITPKSVNLNEAFRITLDSMRESYGFPGATAAYAWTDGRTGVASTGFADMEAGTPMTPESRMLAASIGKTFVGATAVSLAEEGVLDLVSLPLNS